MIALAILLIGLLWLYDQHYQTQRAAQQEFMLHMQDMGHQLYNLTIQPGNENPGYVYIVRSDTGHYKIGRTADPSNRLRTFGLKLPVEIEPIILIKTGDMVRLEKTLHQQYRHKRINGEWFSLCPVDLVWLSNYPGNTKPYNSRIRQ